jgi:hypothetical protein
MESGTWNQLSEAYRNMKVPLKIPSGLRNRYGKILYRFPTAVKMTGCCNLFNALVCAKQWTFFSVKRERDIVLNTNDRAYKIYIENYRDVTIKRAIFAFHNVKRSEKQHYDSRSYFYLGEMHGFDNIPAFNLEKTGLPTAADNESNNNNGYDNRDEKMEFAEKNSLFPVI